MLCFGTVLKYSYIIATQRDGSYLNISDPLSEVSKFQHHIQL